MPTGESEQLHTASAPSTEHRTQNEKRGIISVKRQRTHTIALKPWPITESTLKINFLAKLRLSRSYAVMTNEYQVQVTLVDENAHCGALHVLLTTSLA